MPRAWVARAALVTGLLTIGLPLSAQAAEAGRRRRGPPPLGHGHRQREGRQVGAAARGSHLVVD
jgi:hypothetical protein